MDLYIHNKLGVSVYVTTERRNKEFSLEIGDAARLSPDCHSFRIVVINLIRVSGIPRTGVEAQTSDIPRIFREKGHQAGVV